MELRLGAVKKLGPFCLSGEDKVGVDACVEALEEERKKIEGFKRELPLCMQLISDAIEALREQQQECQQLNLKLSCDYDSAPKALEHFIMNPSNGPPTSGSSEAPESDKPGWQLQETQTAKDLSPSPKHMSSVSAVRPQPQRMFLNSRQGAGGGAFTPFVKPSCSRPVVEPQPSVSSDCTSTSNVNKVGVQERKARRCWSPELHRRFLSALEQLGGSHAATPKQIREIMKVDGLTNDEVKSHLQKYRLHTRRPAAIQAGRQESQLVVLGGIWLPTEFASGAAVQQTCDSQGILSTLCEVDSPGGPTEDVKSGDKTVDVEETDDGDGDVTETEDSKTEVTQAEETQ